MSDPKLGDLLNAPLENEQDASRWLDVAVKLRQLAGVALRGLPLSAEDVEDLVHEVILRFMDSSSMRRMAAEVHSPSLYLARTLRNAGLDLLRKRERQQRLREQREPVIVPDEVERMQNELDLRRLVALLRNLPPEEQDLIRLRFWEGATLTEIAERHGIAVSTTAYRLMRALASIRRELDKS